jgi:uncharacterized protein with PIN domain
MNKALKEKRKEKRNAKKELKNYIKPEYTVDSLQETLRQIRLVQNEIIRQKKEKNDEQTRLEQIEKSKEQKPLPLKTQDQIFVKHYSSKSDITFPQTQEIPKDVAQDGHVHNFKERSQTEAYCVICGDIKSKQEINYFEITPSIHKLKGVVQKNLNPQRYFAPSSPVAWIGNESKKNYLFARFKDVNSTSNLSIEEFKQKLKPLILDECIASHRLIEKLQNEGYDGEFLGRNLTDPQVAAKTDEKGGILVTEDSEFYESRRKIEPKPCFVRKDDSIDNMVLLIKRHMDEFIQNM